MFLPENALGGGTNAKAEEERKKAFQRIEEWSIGFIPEALQQNANVSVQEIQCGDPNCSPIDTLIMVAFDSGEQGMFGVPAEAKDVTEELLKRLFPTPQVLEKWHRGEYADWSPPKLAMADDNIFAPESENRTMPDDDEDEDPGLAELQAALQAAEEEREVDPEKNQDLSTSKEDPKKTEDPLRQEGPRTCAKRCSMRASFVETRHSESSPGALLKIARRRASAMAQTNAFAGDNKARNTTRSSRSGFFGVSSRFSTRDPAAARGGMRSSVRDFGSTFFGLDALDVGSSSAEDGSSLQSRSSFFDAASSKRGFVKKCVPAQPPPLPFHLAGEMMYCCAVPAAPMPAKDTTVPAKDEESSSDPMPNATPKEARKGRSTITVQNICCALEIPTLQRILRPLDGVSNVLINVAIKTVYIDHDLDVISATEICEILALQSFPATLELDAEEHYQPKEASSTFVTSVFLLQQQQQEEDHAALFEEPTQQLEQVRAFLGTYDLDQVQSFFLHDVVPASSNNEQDTQPPRRLTVVHNSLLLSATHLLDTLREKMPELCWTIEANGTNKIKWEFKPVEPEEMDTTAQALSTNTAWPRPHVMLSGFFWIVSMLSFVGGNWDYLKYVALLAVALGIPPILIKALHTLRRFQFDTNCLMLFAIIGALALGEFTEAAAVTFLFALSDWLEVRATTRAREALTAIVELRPETANLLHPETKEIVVVPATALVVGLCVSVKAGDKIPCDGVVVEGCSTVDESSLTGEARPVTKGPKDTVSGGTLNSGNTQMIVRVTSASEDSAVARLIRLVEEAQTNRSATERLVETFAAWYTPMVLLAALSMCTIPWAWGHEVGMKWTHNGLVLLVIACPCALIISTPVSYVAGLAATAQRGIIIKGGAYLEALGRVKKICFDKTGTLTQGKFQMLNLNVIGDNMTRKQILEFLYLMEERATHPMAQALAQGAKNEIIQIPKSLFVKDHTFLAGEGVSGVIGDSLVHVGNARLFKRLGIYGALSEEDKRIVEEWEAIGGTIGFMSVGKKGIVCAYCVMDSIRPEAKDNLAKLKKKGIEAYMLTGDQQKAAITIGKQLGLSNDSIQSELLPEEKLTIVKDFKDDLSTRRGGVMMVGDGVNDAPALATADIGVAMGEGAALAMETADVTLIDSNLSKLVYSITMGARVVSKIQQNITFSLVVKFAILGFAVAGKVQLWMAILVDVGSMLLVTWNSMSLIPRKKQEHESAITTAKNSFADNADKTSKMDLMDHSDPIFGSRNFSQEIEV